MDVSGNKKFLPFRINQVTVFYYYLKPRNLPLSYSWNQPTGKMFANIKSIRAPANTLLDSANKIDSDPPAKYCNLCSYLGATLSTTFLRLLADPLNPELALEKKPISPKEAILPLPISTMSSQILICRKKTSAWASFLSEEMYFFQLFRKSSLVVFSPKMTTLLPEIMKSDPTCSSKTRFQCIQN